MAPKLGARSGSKKTGKSSKSKADMEPKILKKRRVTRRRLSLNKLVELNRVIHELGGFECSGLGVSWLNMKRGRSNTRIRRTDFPSTFEAHVRVQSESILGDVPTDSPIQSPLKVYERRKKRGSPNPWLNGLDQSGCDANNDDLSSSTFTALAAKSTIEDANTSVVLDQVIVDEQMVDECSPFTALAAIETQRKIVDEPTALAAVETQEKTVDEPMALAAIETQEKTVDEPMALAAIETQEKIVDEPMALAAIETQQKIVDEPTEGKIDECNTLVILETEQKIVDEPMVGKIGEHDNSGSRVGQDVDLGKESTVMAAKKDAWEPLTPSVIAKHRNLEKDNGSSEIGHSLSPNNRDRLVLKKPVSESCIDILKKRNMHGVDTGKKSSKRKKMKRHNPKVVDPDKPFECSTPMPRTPKPARKVKKKKVGQLSNCHGEATSKSRKKSCKRKLYFECSTVDQEELKVQDTTRSQLEVESKLPKMCKKRRFRRGRVSIARLNNLIRSVRDKLSSEYAFIVLAEKDLKMKRLKTQVQEESVVRKSVEHCQKCGNCADEVDTFQDNVFLIQDEALGEAVIDFLVKKMESVRIKEDESNQLVVVQGPKDSGESVLSKKKTKGRRKTSIKKDESSQLIVVKDPKDSGAIVHSKNKTRGRLVLSKNKTRGRLILSKKNTKGPLPLVDIDPDTLIVWKLLMDGKWSEATEAEAVGDWDYMKGQRKLWSQRLQLFLRRMRVIQGNKEFTPWKGSILDSIVGVFLTQNTGDSLSSSAFMNLRAKYPPLSLSEQNSLYCRDDQEVKVAGPSLVLTEEPKPTAHVEQPIKNGSESRSIEAHDATKQGKKKRNIKKKPEEAEKDWESWRKRYSHGISRERTERNADSMNYEAIRQAPAEDIAAAIVKRGMSNQLARRMKVFLNRLMRDHGSLDLEWLKHVPPTEAKDYLMSFNGIALKSTECVRLLALHVPAFPVDTNAGRFFVRMGWVPLKPMPDSLKLHLLNQYPVLNSIQEYVWPRICDNSHPILYELHCHSVTVAKSFCTKTKPNCTECPMNRECMHFASLRASPQYNLKGSQPKSSDDDSSGQIAPMLANGDGDGDESIKPTPTLEMPQPKSSDDSSGQIAPMLTNGDGDESIKPTSTVAVPQSPVPDEPSSVSDIEDLGKMPSSLVPDEPSSVDDIEDFGKMPPSVVSDEPSSVDDIEDLGWRNTPNKTKIHSSMPENDESSKALVPRHPRVRVPNTKLYFGLSTAHAVYELPDTHPLLDEFDKRDPDDPFPYCFAIYLEDDLIKMEATTGDEGSSCFSRKGVPYQNADGIRGTIMIPCRTANKGAFPLNGTYFQTNEIFADHESSQHPIVAPIQWLQHLNMRLLYCGKSITSICKGIKQCEVRFIFNASYICVREFDRKSRSAKPLGSTFHYCKSTKSKTSQVQKQMLLNSRIR